MRLASCRLSFSSMDFTKMQWLQFWQPPLKVSCTSPRKQGQPGPQKKICIFNFLVAQAPQDCTQFFLVCICSIPWHARRDTMCAAVLLWSWPCLSQLSFPIMQWWVTLPKALQKCFQPLAQQLPEAAVCQQQHFCSLVAKATTWGPLDPTHSTQQLQPSAPSPAPGTQCIWNLYHHPQLLALTSVCIHLGKCCLKGILRNLKRTDCKLPFSVQEKYLYLAFFFQESSFTGPEVKLHSKLIHRGMCPMKNIAATKLLTSYIA